MSSVDQSLEKSRTKSFAWIKPDASLECFNSINAGAGAVAVARVRNEVYPPGFGRKRKKERK
jgi:hypothetical protein